MTSAIQVIRNKVSEANGAIYPVASIELIGPKEAERMLQGNENNYRKLNMKLVQRYSEDMTRGMWSLTTGAIGIEVGGVLTNGQHRLNAVIDSGVASSFVVVRNMPAGASQDPNEDTGSRRSVHTHLTNNGIANSGQVAAIARFLWCLRHSPTDAKRMRQGVSDSVVAKIAKENIDIVDAASRTKNLKVSAPSVAGSWYWIANIESPDLASVCVDVLGGKVDCSTSHPFARLRDVLLQCKSEKNKHLTPNAQFRYFMSAWGKAKAGASVKLLRPCNTISLSDEIELQLLALDQ